MNTTVQMIRLLTVQSRKLFALLVLAALIVPLTWTPAHAITFEQAAGRGSAKINELDEMGGFLAKATSKALGKVTLSNIKADGTGLTGDVSLRGKPWTIVINAAAGEKKTFVGFGPKTGFTFGDLIGNNAMSKLFDTMKLTRPILFISAGDVSMGSGDLPETIKTYLGPLYENPDDFTLDLTQGLSLISALDMSKAKILDTAIKFLGGKSSKVQLKGEMDMAVMDSMINVLGAPPGPNLKLSAALPTFRPSIGGKITLPADVQFTLRANYFKGGKWLGLDGKTKFKISSQEIDVTLAQTFHMPTDPGAVAYSKTKISMFDDKPWDNAFGLKWLKIKGYNMLFKAKSDASIYVEFGGSTIFGSKAIYLAGGAGINKGILAPSLIEFSVDDGPDKVGSISLRDMASVYNEMAKATGNPGLVPLDKVPDVAIAGTGLGKKNAPRIKLLAEGAGDDGFELQGILRILGTDVAVVEKAFAKMNSGIEIRAHTAKLKAGPIKFPNSAVEIVVLIDREKGTVPKPRVLVNTQALSLFGSNVEMDMKLFIDKAILKADISASELFQFKFGAFAGFTQPLKTLPDLASADFRLLASLKSDPAAWLRKLGNGAVKKELDKLTPGFAVALKALDTAKAEVSKLSTNIRRARAKVKRERQSAANALKGAEKEVNRLQGRINHFNGRKNYFHSRLRSANQTLNICTWYGLRRSGCHKKFFGRCVVPRYVTYCGGRANVPNYPARAWTEARNLEWRSQEAWALGKVGVLIGAKVTASKTLSALRSGIQKIPVDLDPRVAGLIAAKETAKLALDGAKEAVKGITKFKQILADSVKILKNAPDWFALEKGLIRGSLAQGRKGEPVVLDLTFKVNGKRFKNRMSFWLNNAAANGAQYTLLGLGIVVKQVVKLGKASKIIPNALLDKVENLYFDLKAKADKALAKAIVDNGNIATDPKDAKLRLSRSLELDQKVRRIKREAAQKRLIKLRAKFGNLISKKQLEQLESLTKGSKWKTIPGAAADIGAGANGSVWVIGGGNTLWSWGGKNWRKMPGNGVRIDVGPQGRAWYIGTDSSIYKGDGKTITNIPASARDIGIGADGTAWHIGTNNEAGGGGIYRYNGTGWTKIPGSAVRIDVDPKGNAWVVNKNGNIYRWDGKKWNQMPGQARDIGVGADGTVIIIGTNRQPYVWDGKKWNPMPGGIDHITVDKNGDPWGIGYNGTIFAWDKAGKAKAARITSKPWKPYGGGYGKPTASKEGNIVTVTGLVKNGDYNTPLMTLPKGMRPPGRLFFNLDNHGKPVRMDVFPDGRIFWKAGGRDHKWLSLSGITFSTKKGKPLSLRSGWKNYGGYIPATATKNGDLVTIAGLIKGKFAAGATLLGQLAVGMRPPARMVFNVNNHAKSARVDVEPNGNIWWMAGGRDNGWLSLSGINFSVKQGNGLPLRSGWVNYGDGYAPPTFTRKGDMVTISGLIKGKFAGGATLLGQLPTGFRPPERMVFSVNNHGKSARVDVETNGNIQWIAGGRDHGWLSLSGISFQTDEPYYDQVGYLTRNEGLQYAFPGNRVMNWAAVADHWKNYGLSQGLNAKPLGKCGNSGGIRELKGKIFDPCWYINKYPDLKKAFGKGNLQAATDHWFRYGILEGRLSNAGVSTIKTGVIMNYKVKHSGKCIDTTKNGAQGQQTQTWDCVGNANQRFNVVYKEGVWFNLVNERTKRCLDVANNSAANGGKVQQWACGTQRNQQWRKIDSGGGWFALLARNSNKCLTVASAGKKNGSKLLQWDCSKGPNQLFKAEVAKAKPQTGGGLPVAGGGYFQMRIKHSNKCVDVASALKTNGANVQQWGCHKGPNQQWRKVDRGGGWFQLQAKHSNKCLDVYGGAMNNGANVIQWKCHGGANQQWRKLSRGVPGYYILQNRKSSRCLDVASAAKNNGGNLQQWDCHNGPNQQFTVK